MVLGFFAIFAAVLAHFANGFDLAAGQKNLKPQVRKDGRKDRNGQIRENPWLRF
jgi:hypothetical protein